MESLLKTYYDFFLSHLVAVAVNKLQDLSRNAYIQKARVHILMMIMMILMIMTIMLIMMIMMLLMIMMVIMIILIVNHNR